MDLTLILIISGVAAIIIAVIAFSLWQEKRRTEEIQQLADELSLQFTPKGKGELLSRFNSHELFKTGHGRKVTNALIGETDEVRLALFDYQYTTGSRKNANTYRQTVAAIDSDQLLPLPRFSLRPESWFDSLGEMLGLQDIDFDEHPEFSKMFVLKSPEEERVRKLFSQPILDWFVGQGKVSAEGGGGQVIFFKSSRRAKPEELKELLAGAYELYGLLIENLPRLDSSPA